MRFLADENFPRAAVSALEALGHDVTWIRIVAPGANDADVLAIAARENRILLTFDKDFGELAARSGLPTDAGIILVRVRAPNTQIAVRRLISRINARNDWVGHFSVIEPGRLRMRSRR
jgi:predicted nuclease of predicted toxin-antitoxin system